jgi:hypothetical protein
MIRHIEKHGSSKEGMKNTVCGVARRFGLAGHEEELTIAQGRADPRAKLIYATKMKSCCREDELTERSCSLCGFR